MLAEKYRTELPNGEYVFEVPKGLKIGFSGASIQDEGDITDSGWSKVFEDNGTPLDYNDHYHHWEDDYDRFADTGAQIFRYTMFPWSRLLTNPESFPGLDDQTFEHYYTRVQLLMRRDIEVMPTLWHWDKPDLVPEGWENGHTVEFFTEYVRNLMYRLQDRLRADHGLELHEAIPNIIVANEPMVNIANSYLLGWWPPQKKNPYKFVRAIWNLSRAIKASYGIIKSIDPEVQVGISKNVANYYPQPSDIELENAINNGLISIAKWYERSFFFELLKLGDGKLPADFYGANYWHSWKLNVAKRANGHAEWLSEYDWHLDPGGLYNVLMEISMQHPDLPIHLTEIGVHFDNGQDNERSQYIIQCMEAATAAIHSGVDLRSFCLWGSIDNVEWHQGPSNSGIYDVDHANDNARIARPSKEVYENIAKTRSVVSNHGYAPYY